MLHKPSQTVIAVKVSSLYISTRNAHLYVIFIFIMCKLQTYYFLFNVYFSQVFCVRYFCFLVHEATFFVAFNIVSLQLVLCYCSELKFAFFLYVDIAEKD
jgi:hypothetical protein